MIFFETSRYDSNHQDMTASQQIKSYSEIHFEAQFCGRHLCLLYPHLQDWPGWWKCSHLLYDPWTGSYISKQGSLQKNQKIAQKDGCASIPILIRYLLELIFYYHAFWHHISMCLAIGKAFESGCIRSFFLGLIVLNEGFKDCKKRVWKQFGNSESSRVQDRRRVLWKPIYVFSKCWICTFHAKRLDEGSIQIQKKKKICFDLVVWICGISDESTKRCDGDGSIKGQNVCI